MQTQKIASRKTMQNGSRERDQNSLQNLKTVFDEK